MTFQKIPGQALCGFADMFEDETRQHLVGGQLTVQSGVASKAKKWTKTPIDKKKAAVLHPVHNVSNLLAASNRVALVLSGALRKAQQKKAATAAATTAARVNVTRAATSPPSVQRAAMARMVAVHGLMAIVGAADAAATKKPLTPKQTAAVAKAKATAKKADQAGAALHQSAVAALAAGKAAKDHASQIKSTYKSRTGVHGYPHVMGADPDPNNPGYLTDGTPDPAYWGSSATPDPNNPGYLTDGTPDPAYQTVDDPAPVIPAIPLTNVINSPVPDDGIKFTGTFSPYDVGSYWYWYGPQSSKSGPVGEMGITGYVYGWNHGNWPNNNLAPQWIWLTGQDSVTHDQKWNTGTDPKSVPDDLAATSSVQGFMSAGLDLGNFVNTLGCPPWGPLIGNPNRSNMKNLRYSMPDKQWFWYLEEAPDSMTAPLKYAAAKAKQIADAADKAAADAQNKQNAKDAADAAAAQAAQDAANALAESAADSELNVAQAQADAASLQAQSQQAQLDIQQQQQDLAERQAAMQQQQQYAPQPQYDDNMQAQPAQLEFVQPGDDGSNNGGFDPEADAEAEADNIEYDYEDQAVVGADGQVIEIDRYGNPV